MRHGPPSPNEELCDEIRLRLSSDSSVVIERRPDFFIVGAPRCGTTALYSYLQQHPDVFMPHRKEPHFFGEDIPHRPPRLDMASYLRLFEPGKAARRVGEATVWYLYSQSAAEQIKAFSPDARIIIMLRRPVEMMYSLHGLFLFTTWEEIADFSRAVAAEPDRRAGRNIPPNTWWPQALEYRWLADYAPHVKRYIDLFGAGAVRVILFDDLRADTAAVVRDTFAFLGLDPAFVPNLQVVNPSHTARSMRAQRLFHSKRFLDLLAHLPPRAFHIAWRALMRLNIRNGRRPTLSREVDEALSRELDPAVARLEQVLGRSLGAWRR